MQHPVSHPQDTPAPAAWRGLLARLWPIGLLVLGLAAVLGLGLDHYLSFEALREHRQELVAFVDARPAVAVLAFIGLYALSTTLSLPGGALLTVAGGFLFGIWIGTAATVVGATIGAIGVFLGARTVLADSLRRRAGPFVARMEQGFRDNALSYMLVLRLVPLFPFFLVNIVPALLGVSLRTYALGTLIGIIPGTFVFASIGAGLGSVLDDMQELSLEGALTPKVIVALVGLAVLSLVPVAYKHWTSARR